MAHGSATWSMAHCAIICSSVGLADEEGQWGMLYLRAIGRVDDALEVQRKVGLWMS